MIYRMFFADKIHTQTSEVAIFPVILPRAQVTSTSYLVSVQHFPIIILKSHPLGKVASTSHQLAIYAHNNEQKHTSHQLAMHTTENRHAASHQLAMHTTENRHAASHQLAMRTTENRHAASLKLAMRAHNRTDIQQVIS